MNYIGLLVWLFIWMFDQARVPGKRVAVAGAVAHRPLPTLMLFILFASEK